MGNSHVPFPLSSCLSLFYSLCFKSSSDRSSVTFLDPTSHGLGRNAWVCLDFYCCGDPSVGGRRRPCSEEGGGLVREKDPSQTVTAWREGSKPKADGEEGAMKTEQVARRRKRWGRCGPRGQGVEAEEWRRGVRWTSRDLTTGCGDHTEAFVLARGLPRLSRMGTKRACP